jgi:putative DNA primase/helicase
MIEEKQAAASMPGTAILFGDVERIREALQFIDPSDRDTWVKMGFAIKDELGDAGFDIWNDWSQQATAYDYNAAKAVWKSAAPTGAVKVGTLFHAAKANGWQYDGVHRQPTQEVLAERRRVAAKAAAEQEAQEARERDATMKKANAIYQAAMPAAGNPYLLRKKVSPVSTLRQIDAGRAASILGYSPKSNGEPLQGELLVVPIKQGALITTLELIDGEKRKAALAGRGTKAGGYWATERLPSGEGHELTLLIGEGVATVLSASAASGHAGVASLSSSNLQEVAKGMRRRYPAATLIILADLVKATGEPDPHAIEAAQAFGGKLAVPDFGRDRAYDMKDFNDLAQLQGAEAVALGVANARQTESITDAERESDSIGAEASNGWPEPQPLAVKAAREPYPLDALPDSIRAAVQEVAAFVKAPLPMVAMSALAALSLAVQAHADVKRLEKLYGPIGLFLLAIADSGERKSTCDGFFTKAIYDYEAAQAEAAKPELKDYNAALEAWDAKRAGIKEKIRQLAKDNKPTANMEAALRDLEHDKPQPPKIPRLLYADATPEALAFGLAKQWPSAGVVSAEAGIVFGSHGMGKDSVMRNLALLNQLWDGKSVTVDRRSSESFKVHGARLTVALQVQEPTLREFFARTGALARGTGFLARFLMAWPESTQGTRQIDPCAPDGPVGWPNLAAFERRISEILQQPLPIGEDDALAPPVLPLSADARAAWIEFHNAIESALPSGGELYDVRDVASKSADNAVRLAALFHVFQGGAGAIGVGTFEGASRIVAWHLNEARHFLGTLAVTADVTDAARLDAWMITRCKQGCTDSIGKNYIRQHGPIRDGLRFEAAVAALAELGRVRLAKDGKHLTLQLNPSLLIEGA